MEFIIWNMEYLFFEGREKGEREYTNLQYIYAGFFSEIPLFLVCLLNFHLLKYFIFYLFHF